MKFQLAPATAVEQGTKVVARQAKAVAVEAGAAGDAYARESQTNSS